MDEGSAFETEIQTYLDRREFLLKHYKDQYVLLRGKNFGVYKTCIEAFLAGRQAFGHVPLLVINIADEAEA